MGTTSVRLNNVVQNLPSWCHDLYFAAENMTGVRAILEEGAKANSKKRTPTKAYEVCATATGCRCGRFFWRI